MLVALADLEAEQCMAPGRQDTEKLGKIRGRSAGGEWNTEYQAKTPPSCLSSWALVARGAYGWDRAFQHWGP